MIAQPGFGVLLAYNPGLVGATDIPDAWRSRFPATLEVTSNWAALVKLGAPEPLVAAAQRLDALRMTGEDGLVWTPQFRDIESLHEMMLRVGERAAIGFFCSNLHEQHDRRHDPGRRERPPRAGCSTRPATATCGSARARRSPTCTATRGRSPDEDRKHHATERGRDCSPASSRARSPSAGGSTPSTRRCPITGR